MMIKSLAFAAALAAAGAAVVPGADPPRPIRPLHKGHIDVSTGLYVREDDDLVVPTMMPIVLRRTYLSGYHVSREFGIGATHPGEWYIHGDSDPTIPWGDLILADGGRIHFYRISPGVAQEDAVLLHDATPTEFNGALLSWTGSLWEMRMRDGAKALFKDCQRDPDVCSVVERRAANGRRVEYVRDPAGRLMRMESEGRSISFEYDGRRRIVRATDPWEHAVSYSYDAAGRLVRADGPLGVVRKYDYNDRDELIRVREPGRIVENTFDSNGRVVKQTVKSSDADDDPWTMTFRYVVRDGSVVETDIGEADGTRTVHRYNAHHYLESETMDADGVSPATLVYERDSANVLLEVTVACRAADGPTTATVRVKSELSDEAKTRLAREHCAGWND